MFVVITNIIGAAAISGRGGLRVFRFNATSIWSLCCDTSCRIRCAEVCRAPRGSGCGRVYNDRSRSIRVPWKWIDSGWNNWTNRCERLNWLLFASVSIDNGLLEEEIGRLKWRRSSDWEAHCVRAGGREKMRKVACPLYEISKTWVSRCAEFCLVYWLRKDTGGTGKSRMNERHISISPFRSLSLRRRNASMSRFLAPKGTRDRAERSL